MTRDEIKRWWFDLFGVKFKNSATYRAVEAKLEQICNAHEAELKAKDEQIEELEKSRLRWLKLSDEFNDELKAKDEQLVQTEAGYKEAVKEVEALDLAHKTKDERIAELQAMVQNMCAECECAKFADSAIKPSEMWKLHTMLKDKK